MENIDDYIDKDASAEERQAAEQVLDGLNTLRLQNKVQQVAALRANRRRNAWRRIFGLLSLLLLLVVGVLYFWPKRDSSPPEIESFSSTVDPTTPPQQQETLPTQEEEIQQEEPPAEQQPARQPAEQNQRSQQPEPPTQREMPIAQATPLPDPSFPAPSTFLRGQGDAPDATAKERLDQLWYTDYPLRGLTPGEDYASVDEALQERNFTQAFIRLQRAERRLAPNDTLNYLKAYTLLEMGEGAEAARLLSALNNPAASWTQQSDWYRALALLMAGEEAQAQDLINTIASKSQHIYQQHAKKAQQVYGWE